MVRSDSASPRSSTCGRSVCLREKASSCRTRLAARLAFCLICMMSWNDGSVGRCALSRKSVAIMMAPSTLLKSCAMLPASWPTGLHLLLLGDLVFQRCVARWSRAHRRWPLPGRAPLLDRRDIEARRSARPSPSSAASTGAISPCPSAALRIAASSGGAVALGDDGEDRAVVGAGSLALEQRMEQPREQRVGAGDLALLVDRGDRHRACCGRSA